MTAVAKRRLGKKLTDLVLAVLPEQGEWTDEEYLWFTDHTNRLIELTDGYLEPLPMPTKQHQILSSFLFCVLKAFLEPRGGMVLYAALRLRLRTGRFREPDVLAVLDAKDPRCENRFWLGADLVAEIVSEDDPDRDLVQKKRDYAQAGIPEYWIVNPLDESVTVYRLQAKRYVRHGLFRRGDQATSALLPGFTLDVTGMFNADR